MTIISLFYNIIKADNLIYNWLQTFNSRIEVSITSIYFEMLVDRLYNSISSNKSLYLKYNGILIPNDNICGS